MLILVYLPCPRRDVGTLFVRIVSLLPIKQIKYYTCFLNTSWSGIKLNYCMIYFFNIKNTYCVVCLILNFDIYMYYLKYADMWIKAIESFTFLHSPDVLLFSAGSFVSLRILKDFYCMCQYIFCMDTYCILRTCWCTFSKMKVTCSILP